MIQRETSKAPHRGTTELDAQSLLRTPWSDHAGETEPEHWTGIARSVADTLAVDALAGVLCALAVGLKYKFGVDDSLDVVGVHLVGGLWGTIAVGFFGSATATAGVDGLFYGGGVDQLWRQAVGAIAVLLYSFILTLVIGFAIAKTIGFRIEEEDEVEGIDFTEHSETGYDFVSRSGGSSILSGGHPSTAAQSDAEARGINA